MLRRLVILLLLALVASPAAAAPTPWPLERYVPWRAHWELRTIRVAGLTARIERKVCGKDRPASEGCAPGDGYLVVTVGSADLQATTVEGNPGVGALIGIGKLTPGARRPSLILISDDGGSGGCVQIDLVVPEARAYRGVRLSVGDSDHGTFCGSTQRRQKLALPAWPRDLTHRGRPEFLLLDGACGFSSRAACWQTPRVVAFDGQRGIDVSSDPRLAPLYRADMARARHACEQDVEEAQGACAGYAADAARLGQLPEAWRVIAAQVRRGCRVAVSGTCPDINRIPAGFPDALAAALRRRG